MTNRVLRIEELPQVAEYFTVWVSFLKNNRRRFARLTNKDRYFTEEEIAQLVKRL